jgi:hypothetical protein
LVGRRLAAFMVGGGRHNGVPAAGELGELLDQFDELLAAVAVVARELQ